MKTSIGGGENKHRGVVKTSIGVVKTSIGGVVKTSIWGW